MRIAALANFYGPRSGGLRTALHHLGAGYAGRGHEVVLVVPGSRAARAVAQRHPPDHRARAERYDWPSSVDRMLTQLAG